MTARRTVMRRRSAQEWLVRGSLAAVVVVVGGASMSWTLAQTLRGRDPQRAHAMAPGDGRITALLAATQFGADATPSGAARAAIAARLALRQDPTAVQAASVLGFDRHLNGDTPAARRLFAYAATLSRRDLQTQLWQVEDAVARGDVPAVLRHYDIALRTSRAAADLLFPILASAITDPAVRAATVRTLAARPQWGDGFISFIARGDGDPRVTASLFDGLRRAGAPVFEEASAATINTLVARGFIDQAWSYYAGLHPGADRRRSRDPRFTANPRMPSPFDWVATSDEGVNAALQRGERGGVVDFTVSAGAGGPILRQMQVLRPGRYRLYGRSEGIDRPEGARPYWSLTCSDGRELGRALVPRGDASDGTFGAVFVVPAGCPVQTLTLMARPSEAMQPGTGQISLAQLEPAA